MIRSFRPEVVMVESTPVGTKYRPPRTRPWRLSASSSYHAGLIEIAARSAQQIFRGDSANSCPLEIPNLSWLPLDLTAHVFYFRAG
jgi:hypothetical protein